MMHYISDAVVQLSAMVIACGFLLVCCQFKTGLGKRLLIGGFGVGVFFPFLLNRAVQFFLAHKTEVTVLGLLACVVALLVGYTRAQKTKERIARSLKPPKTTQKKRLER